MAQRRLAMPDRQSPDLEFSSGSQRRRSFGELLVIAAGFALAMLGAVEVMQQQSGTGTATAQTPVAASRPHR
ncbi:MAG: hypothetical protein ACLPYS_19000 [Vulcanimicrobiaceae bacterium]